MILAEKGYYLQRRPLDFTEIQLLAQCICAAKFITADQSERLFKSICKFISEYQEDDLWETSFLFEKGKTNKPGVFFNIPVINDAMSTRLNAQPHIPEKIEFNYSEYIIDEISHCPVLKDTNRRIVSPYKFLTSDGNIFLLGYDDALNQMQTYRIDYISNISHTGIPRTGREAYKRINLHEYVRSNFLMQGNMQSHMSILFEKTYLDTVVQRFGINDARYSTVDSLHFIVDTNVEINSVLYNWLLGFGTGAKILKPEWAAEAFLKHIDKIKNTYNEKQ